MNYVWAVILRNDKMGFQKSFNVIAPRASAAIAEAYFQLETRGSYNGRNFEVISLTRQPHPVSAEVA